MEACVGSWRDWPRPVLALALACAASVILGISISADGQPQGKLLNPAAWGSDHVESPVPDYTTGGECLFCHRREIGSQWAKNRHHLTIRPLTEEPEVIQDAAAPLKVAPRFVLGGEKLIRFLRRSSTYGKLDLHPHAYNPATRETSGEPKAAWQPNDFGRNCAGCHTTGVDPKTHAFSSLSIDCFSCHGEADLKHTADSSLMLLSAKRKEAARVTVSICAQCHIRSGRSRSSGLPYASNFVPGDNLFRDLKVSFADEAMAALSPVDRHILENVRDVVRFGNNSVSCLTCHQVHRPSADRHQRLPKTSAICANCHESRNGEWTTKDFKAHSATCRY
ncbi:MAG: multiheme c-type cytochrome [Verrucomicrobiales bacterium]